MSRASVLVAVILLAAACGRAGGPGQAASESEASSLCQDFIDATAGLADASDYSDYTAVMNEAAAPVFDAISDADRDLPQQVMASWENLANGSPTNDDLEAIHHLGGVLVPDYGPTCEELGRNILPVPPEVSTVTPPPVEMRSIYEENTVDHACDVFIQTLHGWAEARSGGAEIGAHIADLTDELIGELESHGIDAGLDDLAAYAGKYREHPIVRAAEEAGPHLEEASRELAEFSPACAHLSTWTHSDDRPVDLDYHRSRWEALGFDDYTARIRVDKPETLRGEREILVVVEGGEVSEIYAIRTGETIDLPVGVPLTVDALLAAVEDTDDEQISFHPVLGYPDGTETIHLIELSEGTRFDHSILGSTADAITTVETVDEFQPGQACGAATVPGGEPIPDVDPLDEDARQAFDALAANVEGERFASSYEYGIFSRVGDTLVLLGDDGAGNLAFASFERDNGRWTVTSFGTCSWDEDGYEQADWTLDPETTFDDGSPEVRLLARDECASHTRFGNEFLVVEKRSASTVELVVWRADDPPPPPEGPELFEGDCPADEIVQLTVILDEPVGDRELIGATEPADWPSDF